MRGSAVENLEVPTVVEGLRVVLMWMAVFGPVGGVFLSANGVRDTHHLQEGDCLVTWNLDSIPTSESLFSVA